MSKQIYDSSPPVRTSICYHYYLLRLLGTFRPFHAFSLDIVHIWFCATCWQQMHLKVISWKRLIRTYELIAWLKAWPNGNKSHKIFMKYVLAQFLNYFHLKSIHFCWLIYSPHYFVGYCSRELRTINLLKIKINVTSLVP